MSLGTSNKVTTSTQVEYSFVEARSIVGQEDIAVDYVTTNFADVSLRKQGKGIRPPLVGQASSSSNDSVSLSCDSNRICVAQNRPTISPTHTMFDNTDQNKVGLNDSVDNIRTSNLINRNDYISQKPPEGSYNLIGTGTSLQPIENNNDLTRVRSSSSASSVTSSRPLEWDNGADVGYSQSYFISGKLVDPSMSTVERMALVSSTKLLRRSDPEGTTGGTTQQVKSSIQPKMRVKNKVGHPNAESTPLGTCATSDTSPDTVDFISPIPYEKKEDSEPELNNSSESEVSGQKLLKHLKERHDGNQTYLFHIKDNTKCKIPLFPEMDKSSSMQNNVCKLNKSRDSDENDLYEQCSRSKHMADSCASGHNNTEPYMRNKIQQFNNELQSRLESVGSPNMVQKKLSSSLENVSNLSNDDLCDGKNNPNTLPRSHSQSDLYVEKLSHEIVANSKGYNIAKDNIAIQNLFKNKSASSSSVATVVQRKGDSPKHALVQTSIFNRQSVGTQVNESIERCRIKSKIFTGTAFSETPHLPKAVLTQQLMKRSNYFDFNNDSSKDKNSAIVQPIVESSHGNFEEENLNSATFGTHFHNGILCRGAHKKKLVTEPSECKNQCSTNLKNNSTIGLHTSTNQLKSAGCSSNLNTRNNISGGVIDSVESSAKSGGCGTDKQYSVTVEDRVNSFEYLPGHVYENNERQQPLNSCGTSSMSIENQTSNNGTPENQNRIWESSGGSMSSTFEKDAQRGVDILSDFVKGTYENNTLLKRKLLRRVVDKLISKNHIDRKIECYRDLMKNTPWVPPRPSNPVERNNVRTPKSKVPCEFSSHSEKSGTTTNTSSVCFIPRAATKNNCFPSFPRNDPCHKDQGELSSTSNVTFEKPVKHHDRPIKSHQLMNSKSQKIRKNGFIKQSGDSSSEKVVRSSNWKEPVTKTEKLIEEKRKTQNELSRSHSNVSQLLDMERDNQLFWIRSEIEHLSNLKLLLEKQEELKLGLKNCQPRHNRLSERGVLKDQNRVQKDKTKTVISDNVDLKNKKSSLKTKSTHPPKLRDWLKDSVAVPQQLDVELEGWASHHYENDENIKSCMKRKNKHGKPKIDEKDYVLYDEPPVSLQKRKHDLKHQKRSTSTDDSHSESTFIDEKDHNRQHLTDRVGSRRRVRQPECGCQCLCQGKCQCCTTSARTDNGIKESLGYYIIFDNPKKTNQSKKETHQSEEIGISMPVGERKQKPVSRQRARIYNVREKERIGSEKIDNNGRSSDILDCEIEPKNSENNVNDIIPESKKHIFKGGAGELQYHLLHNRPSYVSRAEDRRQCIAQMQYLRELSSQNKRRLLSLTQPDPPPPPPIKLRRVFSQHKMRQMTEKKYRQLTEVKEKVQDTKKKESYRTNRLMAEIFKKNLQKRALKGEVNLSNSVCVISNL